MSTLCLHCVYSVALQKGLLGFEEEPETNERKGLSGPAEGLETSGFAQRPFRGVALQKGLKPETLQKGPLHHDNGPA